MTAQRDADCRAYARLLELGLIRETEIKERVFAAGAEYGRRSTKPVCETCDDTHEMSLGDAVVMCTACPVPCQKCRRNGTGAFCAEPRCSCDCHKAGSKEM